MSNCFNPANILLPNDGIDMEKWSVIACDQFTSQADYWDAVEKYVGDAPSTLNGPEHAFSPEQPDTSD